jgi:hypothetical protein
MQLDSFFAKKTDGFVYRPHLNPHRHEHQEKVPAEGGVEFEENKKGHAEKED